MKYEIPSRDVEFELKYLYSDLVPRMTRDISRNGKSGKANSPEVPTEKIDDW